MHVCVAVSASLTVYNLPFCSRLSCRQSSSILPQWVSFWMISLLDSWFIANAAEPSHLRRIPLKFPGFTVRPSVFCHRLSCTVGRKGAGERPSSPEPKGRVTVRLMCMLLDGDGTLERHPSLRLQRRRDSNSTREAPRNGTCNHCKSVMCSSSCILASATVQLGAGELTPSELSTCQPQFALRWLSFAQLAPIWMCLPAP